MVEVAERGAVGVVDGEVLAVADGGEVVPARGWPTERVVFAALDDAGGGDGAGADGGVALDG